MCLCCLISYVYMWNQKTSSSQWGTWTTTDFFFNYCIHALTIKQQNKKNMKHICLCLSLWIPYCCLKALLSETSQEPWSEGEPSHGTQTLTQQLSISLDRSFKWWFSPFLRKPSFNFLLIVPLVMNWTIVIDDNTFPLIHTYTSSVCVFSQLPLKWDLTSTLLYF